MSIGHNSYVKTHPLQACHALATGNIEKIYLHAEVHAITRCRRLNKAHKILVTRYGKNGQPLPANPCPVCVSAIRAAGIKLVEHT